MNTQQIEKFLHDGWVIVNIPKADVIFEYAAMLEEKAREITRTDCTLSNVHTMLDEDAFTQLHVALSEYFWQSEFSIKSAPAFLPVLKELIGLDIMVQYSPYFRLARPHKASDNIGYHIDTQYGQTPYELAVHVPFVDLDEHSALRVVSGSHRMPEDIFASISAGESTVVKGSLAHRLGKPYAPKKLALPEGIKSEALAMRVGQAALFTPAIFHGQEMNTGTTTRVSTDVRFVNTNANTNLRLGKVHAGYVPISKSPVQQLAEEYYQKQKAAA